MNADARSKLTRRRRRALELNMLSRAPFLSSTISIRASRAWSMALRAGDCARIALSLAYSLCASSSSASRDPIRSAASSRAASTFRDGSARSRFSRGSPLAAAFQRSLVFLESSSRPLKRLLHLASELAAALGVVPKTAYCLLRSRFVSCSNREPFAGIGEICFQRLNTLDHFLRRRSLAR